MTSDRDGGDAGFAALSASESRLDSRPGLVCKRLLDCVLGSLLIIASAPVLVVVAMAMRIDSNGPVLFRQTRHGLNGRVITISKFRTMTIAQQAGASERLGPDSARVTGTGGFLRRTGLDELPQLFDVVRGDMSLVGPRPHAIAHDEEFREVVNGYPTRWRMRPGITGWAQVNGSRGPADTAKLMQERFDLDRYYIENWSFRLDLKILWMTVVLFLVSLRKECAGPGPGR